MSKEITSDILNKINQIKQKKTDKENSSKPVDPFMGFDITKEGLSQFKKAKESNLNDKIIKDSEFKVGNNSNSNNNNLKSAINDIMSKEVGQSNSTSK
jgi:hypothetical protein